MSTKSELFEQYNGKRAEVETDVYIVCNLRHSWSLDKIRQVIAQWEKDVASYKEYVAWKEKLLTHGASLGYTPAEVSYLFSITLEEFRQGERDNEIDIKAMEERLFANPNNRQYHIILQKTAAQDRHIRLYGDGRIAVGSSEGDWYEIQLDGSCSPLKELPRNTVLYSQQVFIKLSDDFGVEAKAVRYTYRTFVYFQMQNTDPKWDRVEIYQSQWDKEAIVKTASINCNPEIAIAAADALKLGAAIAQDFQTFLDNPHEWIYKQCKIPRPYDAVLSR